MRLKKIHLNQSITIKLFLGFFSVYVLFIVVRAVIGSVLFHSRDRITIVFYKEQSIFVSFGLTDKVNYIGYFDNGANVYVPGGYGRYKIGSLGRLSELEKNPEIFHKAFSSILSAYVDFYFYPKENQIYSFEKQPEIEQIVIPELTLLDVLFQRNFATNAGLIDRFYIFMRLQSSKRSDFSLVSSSNSKNEAGERVFHEDTFERKYQGFFYQNSLRNERKEVQILYKQYKTALLLTRIIEGEGIRVVDLSTIEKNTQNCIIGENSQKPSKTAHFLTQLFNCTWRQQNVETADIAFILGDKLEKSWGE